jgi:BirA family transcriptional regulator, biotin operon repressor / biotin---[acetyl-CoA-carboxylase] ligase
MAGPFLSREQSFAVVGSTNDIVRDWLAEGTAEVCLAVADEQSHGRGREARTWTAPRGAGLLLSVGFRPAWLAPEKVWRLAAVASLAMADAADEVAGLRDGTVRLKWPNDLVVERESSPEWLAVASPSRSEGHRDDPAEAGGLLKLGGVLGETDGLGTSDPRAIVGLGVNVDWERDDFPTEIAATMTSLREVAARKVTPAALLGAFLPRLEARVELLRSGGFDAGEWQARQVTTGRIVRLELPGGQAAEVHGVGVDGQTGALLVDADDGRRAIFSGEVRHVRLAHRDDRVAARVKAGV